MIRVGIIGYGLMGRTHVEAFRGDGRVRIAALADINPDRFTEAVSDGNVQGQGGASFDPSSVRRYHDAETLLSSDSIDAVSICAPTRHHVEMAMAALKSGKHVLVEKPLGLTSVEAERVEAASHACPDLVCMPAMCMRFWPAWSWLKSAINDGRYGRVLAASFVRLGPMPGWADFYADARQSGAAILDLHIHDADFVRFCFGDPDSVQAKGYSQTTDGVDHLVTQYRFQDGPALVTAEGGWSFAPSFPFSMRYVVNFQRATALFQLGGSPELRVFEMSGGEAAISLPAGDGYHFQAVHFLDCIEQGTPPVTVTVRDGVDAVRLVEAERESVHRGGELVAFAPL